MATKERLEQALRNADKAGDVAAAKRFADAIRNGEYDQPQISDVPGAEQDAAIAAYYAQQQSKPKPERSFADKAIGVGEALMTIGSGATSGLIGQLAGTAGGIGKAIQFGQYGTAEGADLAEQIAMDTAAASTYQPRTEAGREYLSKIGEVAAPLAAIPPIREAAIIAQTARPAIQMAARPITSTAKAGIAELGEAAKKELSLVLPSAPEKQIEIIKKIREGSTENELAPFKLELKDPKAKDNAGNLLPQAYKVVDDQVAKEALGQGWEPGTVQSAKNFDQKTSEVAKKMLEVAEKGTRDDTFKANNRPISELGSEIARQIAHIRRVNRESGNAINEAAKKLKDSKVDVTPAVDRFITSVSDDLGVTITPSKGGVVIDFRGSNLEGNTPEIKSAQGVLKNLVNRMYNTKTPSAYDVHRLKGYIDTQASYGSQLGGLKGNTDRIVKNLRHDLDAALDDNFPEYNQANTVYAETKQALDLMQELVGKKVDLRSDSASQSLGKITRRILSNAQSAERVREAALNINDVAVRYGAENSGDIPALVKFSDTLDKQFGIAADTSLASEVAKGVSQSKTDTALNVGKAFYQKAKGVNNKKKYLSMKKLLERQESNK